jgi:Protein of unknown function (DUF2009)
MIIVLTSGYCVYAVCCVVASDTIGDDCVPNALVFLQKYVQIPWMLAPILQCIDYLDHLTAVTASISHAKADTSATSTAAAAAASSNAAPALSGHNGSTSGSSSSSQSPPQQQQQQTASVNSASGDVKAADTSASASTDTSVATQHGDIEAIAYISQRWESPKRLKQHILRDFFKFAFDGKLLYYINKACSNCEYLAA